MWSQTYISKTEHTLSGTRHFFGLKWVALNQGDILEYLRVNTHHFFSFARDTIIKWISKIFGLLWRFADLWVKYHVCLCIHIENLYPIPCPGDVQQVPGFLSSMLPLKMTGTLLWSPPTPSSESLTCAFKPHTVMIHFKERTKGFWVVVLKGKWCITLE